MTALITGNTYPVRFALKALGGVWDARAKGWRVPVERADEARALVGQCTNVEGANGSRPRFARRSSYTRFASGAEVFTNRAGRCEDAPCCGCCS